MLKPCSRRTPEDEAKFLQERAKNDVNNSLASEGAPLKIRPTGSMGTIWYQMKRFANTMARSDSQISEPTFGAIGKYVTWEDIYSLIADPPARATLRAAITEKLKLANVAESEILRHMHVSMRDMSKVVRQIHSDTKISKAEIYKDLYKAYVDPTPDNIAILQKHPGYQEALKIVDSEQKYLSDKVLNMGGLPKELKDKIIENNGKYMFRQYSIHRDPDLVYQRLERSAMNKEHRDAYDALYKEFREGNDWQASRWREDIINSYRSELQKARPDLSEEAITARLEIYLDNRIKGEIASIVKHSLNNPSGPKAVKSAVLKAKGQYLVERVIEDPNVRKLMGEEMHAELAIANLAGKVAHDVKAGIFRKAIYDELKKAGLLSDNAIGDLDRPFNRRTMRRFREDDELLDPKAYTNAAVADVLDAVEPAIENGLGQTLSKGISLIKLGKILSPRTLANNLIGTFQSSILATGLGRTILSAKNPMRFLQEPVVAFQVAKEIAMPGSTGFKKGSAAAKWLESMGFQSIEEIRETALDLLRRGLDAGGEYAAESVHGIKTALKGDPGLKMKQAGALRKAATFGMEVYRTPDVAAKVYVYRQMIEELMFKEGLKGLPTEDVLNRAAKQTLMLTQDPRTTASFVRNLSRSGTGVMFGGFQGFYYQMARNYANSMKLAVSDAVQATMAIQRGDIAKGARYGVVATDRLISTAFMGYGLYSVIEKAYNTYHGRTEEEVASMKEFLRPEQRNSTLWMGKTEVGKNGEKYVELVYPGSIDVYDTTMQIVRSAMRHGSKNPMAIIQESKDAILSQILGPGIVMEAIAKAGGYSLTYDPSPEALVDVWDAEKREPIGFKTITQGALSAGPAVPANLIKALDAAYDKHHPESDKAYEKAKSTLYSLQSQIDPMRVSASGERFNLSQGVRNRLTEEYKKETWLPDVSRKYRQSRSLQEKSDLIKQNEKNWDAMVSRMIAVGENAENVGLTRSEIYRIIKDKDGYIGLSKDLAKSLALGRRVSLRNYLNGLD